MVLRVRKVAYLSNEVSALKVCCGECAQRRMVVDIMSLNKEHRLIDVEGAAGMTTPGCEFDLNIQIANAMLQVGGLLLG